MAVAEARAARLLVVEDEAFLREVVAESLEETGYDVVAVGDGGAGLAALESDASFDVLVSDIRLPGISGYELAAAGKALRPELKVILMTGYAPSLPPELEPAVYRVLQKPFRIDCLASVVADAIAGADAAAT
ncbi:MAG TPA: response regulator [Rhodanobacteraceae bacterium]|jgi:CheY-like chemotaxis protein|nr:response regulator [Rhodanobacteraceae bacterium]